ncbi:MAG: VWA domain-containing protein [Bacilli bacterium]|nr:VWA domain-containing protein [Bacilli bacterium]
MRAFPIIPTIIMLIICVVLIIIILKSTKKAKHIILVILLFFLNQRYMIPTDTSSTTSNNIDVLFVIDKTISMNALDYQNNQRRLDGVKADCLKIMEELNGARFGIITFDNKARTLIPFTQDSYMAREAIEIIEPIGEWYAKGSSLNTPLEEIKKVLENEHKKAPKRVKVLFFISDGEITDKSTLNSYASLNKYIQDGAVLGYGTKEGAIMYYIDDEDIQHPKQRLVMDTTVSPNKEAISKIDEKNLKQIATDLKIDYIHMDNTAKINEKIKKIKTQMEKEMNTIPITSYDDTYFILAPIILLLLVLDLKKVRRDCV